MNNLEIIEKKIGYKFKKSKILDIAFTHSSVGHMKHIEYNERLEFLGDSILNFLVGQKLFFETKLNEGELSKERARLVSSDNLSKLIDNLDCIEFYKLQNITGEISNAMKCDLFEAIVGAIFVDGGLEEVKEFLSKTLFVQSVEAKIPNNYKTELQEFLQQSGTLNIEYRVLNVTGKSHSPEYEIGLFIDDKLMATSVSGKKKIAENQTAKMVLEKLKNN